MAERGRKPKINKKEREAIYVEPDLLAWIKRKAEERNCTPSEFICSVLEGKRSADIKG